MMVLAGQPAGDSVGAELVRAIRARAQDDELSAGLSPAFRHCEFFGSGGPSLQAAGVEVEFDLTAPRETTIWETIWSFRKNNLIFERLVDQALRRQPDIILLIDKPYFNLRFANALKKARAKTGEDWRPKIVFYSTWQRPAADELPAEDLPKAVDLLLTNSPVEAAAFSKADSAMKAEFVGHPIIDRYTGADYGSGNDLEGAERRLLLLPGKDEAEIRLHLPIFADALSHLRMLSAFEARMVLPSEFLWTVAREVVVLSGVEVLVGGQTQEMAGATVAMAPAGSDVLECACFRLPAVVFKSAQHSGLLAGASGVPNALAGEPIYPEIPEGEKAGESLAREAALLINSRERRDEVRAKLDSIIESLGGGGGAQRAAQALFNCLRTRGNNETTEGAD